MCCVILKSEEMLISSRKVPILSGEEGDKFVAKVWEEIIQALEKDNSEVRNLIPHL